MTCNLLISFIIFHFHCPKFVFEISLSTTDRNYSYLEKEVVLLIRK